MKATNRNWNGAGYTQPLCGPFFHYVDPRHQKCTQCGRHVKLISFQEMDADRNTRELAAVREAARRIGVHTR